MTEKEYYGIINKLIEYHIQWGYDQVGNILVYSDSHMARLIVREYNALQLKGEVIR